MINRKIADLRKWPMTFFSVEEFWKEFANPLDAILAFTPGYVNAIYVLLFENTWVKIESSDDETEPALSSESYGYMARLYTGERVLIYKDDEIMWLDQSRGVYINDAL